VRPKIALRPRVECLNIFISSKFVRKSSSNASRNVLDAEKIDKKE
jgi:hypothetical protein